MGAGRVQRCLVLLDSSRERLAIQARSGLDAFVGLLFARRERAEARATALRFAFRFSSFFRDFLAALA